MKKNVFVLCTGRCGSVAFTKACSHIKNYSSAHESRSNMLGRERFNYPLQHIEADNRLSWVLGRLDYYYGDNAYYVHLRRNDVDVASSFVKRYGGGIIKAYRGDGIIMGLNESTDPLSVCLDYVDTVNRNIASFLKDKSKSMSFSLENYAEDFIKFCDFIEADIEDIGDSLLEFNARHNSSRDK